MMNKKETIALLINTNLANELHSNIVDTVQSKIYYQVFRNVREIVWDTCQDQIRRGIESKLKKEH